MRSPLAVRAYACLWGQDVKTICTFLGAVFLYSLCANIANRLFHRFDPPYKYSDQSPGMWYDKYEHKQYPRASDQETHNVYILVGTILWPGSLMIWLIYWGLFRLPYRIVMKVERVMDRSKDPPSNTPYRG